MLWDTLEKMKVKLLNVTKMKEFKIRCSAIGQIMTNSRSKSETLSKTTKSYLQEWVKEQIYKRKKTISSKYLEKGLIMEDNSLDYIAEHLGYGRLKKNEEHFNNEFLTGTPDVILKDHLIDVKNSWDCFTFPMFETDINKNYFYQAQGYMALTGLDSYKLIYTLMDTPEYLIQKDFKFNNFYQKDYDEFEKDFRYDKVDSKYRIKVYEIKKDDEVIKAIYERVAECRTYINELLT